MKETNESTSFVLGKRGLESLENGFARPFAPTSEKMKKGIDILGKGLYNEHCVYSN